MPETLQYIIADSQDISRLGLLALLREHKPEAFIAGCYQESDLLQLLEKTPGALVILDYSSTGFSAESYDLIKSRYPGSRVMLISDDQRKEQIYELLRKGVNQFVTKHCGSEEILDALSACEKQERFYCHQVLDLILERSFPAEDPNCAPLPLSSREIQIVQKVLSGQTAKEIAFELELSVHTVYTHRKNILKKLGVSTTPEMYKIAVQMNWIQ